MIIKANIKHIDDILEIENSSYIRPWTKQSFINEIDSEISSNWVYISSSKLIGYLFGWKIENEFHINNIATHRKYRRTGVAKKMIDNVVTNLLPQKVYLEVSSVNNRALMFYKTLGFKKNGIRKRYYSDNSDAIMYKMDIK
tara:strand:- start:3052 stop:3474 length:423 start_codon:yes stop_codon:yes gene_type:complete